MLKLLRFGCVLLAGLAGATANAADADTVARIAGYAGADRQAILEAGARREGEVQVYTVGSQIDPVLKAFGEAYPFLAIKPYKAGLPLVLKKTMEEYRAGLFNVDAFELDDYGLEMLRDVRLTAPFRSPQSEAYRDGAVEPKRFWVLMREDYASLGFNTDAYSPDQAPQSHADLLDPKWKGKVGASASEATLVNWVGALVVAEGEDFVRRLGRQAVTLYNMGGPAVANFVVSGEVPLLLNARYSHFYVRRKNGGKVAWRTLGPSYTVRAGVALPVRAKNPHAAMLFIDFMLSEAAQTIYRDQLGYVSLRKDMPSDASPPQKIVLAQRPNYARSYEQWSRLADQAFRSGR